MTKTKAQKRQSGKRLNQVRIARGLAPPLPPRRVVIRKVQSQKSKKKSPSFMRMLGHGIRTGGLALMKAVTGFGDYKVQGNSLLPGNPPVVENSANVGGTIVRHREYVGDVLASTNFSLTSYPINAGMSETFPWLAGVSSAYEEYKFRGLLFEFKTMSGNLATSMALGTVVMATQYNTLQPDFPDKRTMENYEFANSDKPSSTFIHPVECKQALTVQDHLYIRLTDAFSGDKRLYDLGNFQIAVQGTPDAAEGSVIGELWATYEVELYKPKLTSTLGLLALTDAASTTTGLAATPMKGMVLTSTSSCGCTFTDDRIKFPINCQGIFYIEWRVFGTTFLTNQVLAVPSTGTNVVISSAGNITPLLSAATGTYNSLTVTLKVKIVKTNLADPPDILFPNTSIYPTGYLSSFVRIFQANYAFFDDPNSL